MAQKIIKLNADEIIQLQQLYAKKKRNTFWSVVFIIAILLLFSLLPNRYTSWITFSRSTHPDENMIQEWGVIGWLAFLLISTGFIGFFYTRTSKIFPLKKDLKDMEKLEVDVEVVGKNFDTRYDYYYMRVSGDSLKRKKIDLSKEQYGLFAEGQKLTIDVYKNSMILLSSVLKQQ